MVLPHYPYDRPDGAPVRKIGANVARGRGGGAASYRPDRNRAPGNPVELHPTNTTHRPPNDRANFPAELTKDGVGDNIVLIHRRVEPAGGICHHLPDAGGIGDGGGEGYDGGRGAGTSGGGERTRTRILFAAPSSG